MRNGEGGGRPFHTLRMGLSSLSLVSSLPLVPLFPSLPSLCGIFPSSPVPWGRGRQLRREGPWRQISLLLSGQQSQTCPRAGLGWAEPLCSRGAQTFVLGILTLCSGSCHPTASPVRSSIPLTPTHHHGNTGSRLSQREEKGGPTPGVPEPPPQICRRTGQLSHMPELLLCTQVSPPEHPQTKTPTATDCVSRWLSPILG